jgi:hypothetical protein
MRITCPGCRKRLNVPASVAGMKVRCSGCKKVVAVPGRAAAADTDPVPVPDRRGAPVRDMRCAACRTPALRALPANQFSRHPGYVCTACGATMRPPGSTAMYVVAIVLGGLGVLVAVVLVAIFLMAARYPVGLLIGPVSLASLGGVTATWAFRQLRLPVPLDAPAGTSRLLLWLLVGLAVLAVPVLAVGCLLFAVLYYLQEMM